MVVEIKLTTIKTQNKFGSINRIYEFEDIRDLTYDEGKFLLIGEFDTFEKFTYEINNVKIVTLYNSKVIDFVISRVLIDNIINSDVEGNENIEILLNLSSEFKFVEDKKKGRFLLILKKDYPERLQSVE